MATRLVVCRACHRHVAEDEHRCPFCSADVVSARKARRAALPLVAAIAVGVAAGCAYGPPPEDPEDAGSDDASADTTEADRTGSDVSAGQND